MIANFYTCIVNVSFAFQGSRVAFTWEMLIHTPYDSCVPHLEPCLEQVPWWNMEMDNQTYAICRTTSLLQANLLLCLEWPMNVVSSSLASLEWHSLKSTIENLSWEPMNQYEATS